MVGSNFQHLSCSGCTGQREGHCTWSHADSPRPQLGWFVDFVDFIIFDSLFWKPLLLPLPSSQINHMGKGFELKAIQTFNFRHYCKCDTKEHDTKYGVFSYERPEVQTRLCRMLASCSLVWYRNLFLSYIFYCKNMQSCKFLFDEEGLLDI